MAAMDYETCYSDYRQVMLQGGFATQALDINAPEFISGFADCGLVGSTLVQEVTQGDWKTLADDALEVRDIPIPFRLLNSCKSVDEKSMQKEMTMQETLMAHNALNFPLEGSYFEVKQDVQKTEPAPKLKSVEWLNSQRTTLMIRNLRSAISTIELKKAIDDRGFSDLYDIIYVPFRVGSESNNLGFAFVNFLSEEAAKNFTRVWHACGNDGVSITFANIQGRDENIKMMKKKKLHRIQDPRLKPFIRDGGALI
eukprot:TRINITY_DN56765_c0_g1_i1.p1 TRINITY_DN56765_c0_g1~~TRINITY_DN56765_c0_g1_i1.p1  ORF type:complete len:254 (-),score=40.31 TRINITY_DN56765_c0_g1_i1:655-1416(-)